MTAGPWQEAVVAVRREAREAARRLGITACSDCGAWTTRPHPGGRCSACHKRLAALLRGLAEDGVPLPDLIPWRLALEGRRLLPVDRCIACRRHLPSADDDPSPLCQPCRGAFLSALARRRGRDHRGATRALAALAQALTGSGPQETGDRR